MMITPKKNSWLAALCAVALGSGLILATGTAAAATEQTATEQTAADQTAQAPLTNLAHLDYLLDTATPAALEGHSSYRLDSEPALTFPWTYADARDGGTFARVGGGPLDPATGYWGQGSYNADDVARASIVYLRDWQQNGSESSKQKAYELLRGAAYFQTTTGPDAGNVVLWMQPDGSLNPSPTPVELPNPSDSGDSYWLARSIWAFGEGFAAFKDADPDFASFLQQRLQLGVSALERQSLAKYGEYSDSDGVQLPSWLIVDGADASAEAVLGLSAYSAVEPGDSDARTALSELSEGIAGMATSDTQQWPYGAILPWAESRSMWHAWASQMPEALARASVTLGDPALLQPAVTDSASFTTTLLTAGGPDNAWYPTPVDTTQIAYGADSRLQSLLAVADASGSAGFRQLAGIMGSWFFGNNKSGLPVYDPATGVTFDGVQADGSVNHGSGAESTIHGLLSMLALDANPDARALAQAATTPSSRSGLTVVEAEAATSTTGTVVTPESAWTGEAQYSGGAYLALDRGQTATFALPSLPAASGTGSSAAAKLADAAASTRHVEPVTFVGEESSESSRWKAGSVPLGKLSSSVGAQGISEAPGALLPQQLTLPAGPGQDAVSVTAITPASIDALIVRPLISRLTLTGASATTELAHSTSKLPLPVTVGAPGATSTVSSYDSDGALVNQRTITGLTTIIVRGGGFAIATTA
jgi:hypothetical protein